MTAQATKIIWTGHPPPLQQVRNQIRSSTGATFASRVTAFTSHGSTDGRETLADIVRPGVKTAIRLMSFLEGIEASGDTLPYPAEIALHIDDGWHADMVMSALRQLARNGDIVMWCGRDETAAAGEFKIRLPGGETVLRTARAPAYGKV